MTTSADLDWTPLESSNVAAAAYDADAKRLHIRFHSGASYVYHDVPPNVHDELLSASSPGGYVRSSMQGFRYSRS